MASLDLKEELHGYLRGASETLIWKLEGEGAPLSGPAVMGVLVG